MHSSPSSSSTPITRLLKSREYLSKCSILFLRSMFLFLNSTILSSNSQKKLFVEFTESFMRFTSSSSYFALSFKLSMSSIFDITLSILDNLAFVSSWKLVKSSPSFFICTVSSLLLDFNSFNTSAVMAGSTCLNNSFCEESKLTVYYIYFWCM